MNIPDEGFFTLLTQGMRNRTVETLQRALYHTLRDAILQGTLTARCRLPGSRVMAERLHLSRNTVNAALEQLALEGYLTRSRQGTQVAPLASCRQEAGQMPPVVLPERLQRLPAAMRRDSPTLAFTPGMPAVNYFPLPLWRRLMDNVLREDGSALLGYGEAAGDPLLREAIARHLALSRGIRCDIRQIVITEGALEGVNLCASLLTNPGDSVWLEEPGYLGARSGFQRAGLRVRGMAVDDEGMCIANGVAEPPRLIFTSPSHQYPCGSIMSAGRRLALVEYARRHGAWIVEDDYDSEFRHSGEPIPAMLGMVPDAPVVYLGTFSKTLFPALRIGFMVMPPALADAAQDAIGALLRGGHRAEQRARQFQLAPAALSHFYLDPQRARSGLVLGYGNTSASRYLPALRTLNRLIAQHRRA
ncbi:TPA: PLP-dependent aminotransferase family protein [Klebsiella pneumoniae]